MTELSESHLIWKILWGSHPWLEQDQWGVGYLGSSPVKFWMSQKMGMLWPLWATCEIFFQYLIVAYFWNLRMLPLVLPLSKKSLVLSSLHFSFRQLKTAITESQNQLGWKRLLTSSSPTIIPGLPSPPLTHVTKGKTIFPQDLPLWLHFMISTRSYPSSAPHSGPHCIGAAPNSCSHPLHPVAAPALLSRLPLTRHGDPSHPMAALALPSRFPLTATSSLPSRSPFMASPSFPSWSSLLDFPFPFSKQNSAELAFFPARMS